MSKKFILSYVRSNTVFSMNQNHKKQVSRILSFALLFSVWGGVAYGQETVTNLFGATTQKTTGDRFTITDFNDIWSFIKQVFVGDGADETLGTADDRIGIGAAPRATIDGSVVTFDLGNAAAEGVLAADKLCDDVTCTDTEEILTQVARGGVGRFVNVTTASTTTAITGAGGTSSLDAAGATTGKITYDADGAGVGVELVGYVAANAICRMANANNSAAHICSEDEIVLSINSDVTAFNAFTTKTFGWVTGGGSKYTSGTPVDDCNAFSFGQVSDDAVSHVGNIWKLQEDIGGTGSAQPCTVKTQIACCI